VDDLESLTLKGIRPYGNSRVTYFAGFVLVLVRVWVKPPRIHLESPDLKCSEAGAWPSMSLRRSRVADGYEQVRAVVVMRRNHGAGLKFGFGDADAVFDEEDLFRAALEDVEGAVFILAGVPLRGGISEGGIFEDFDGDIAERAVTQSADIVGERGGGEAGVSVCEFYGDRRLVFDIVGDFGGAEGYGDVVVTVPVGQGFCVGRNFDVEDADGFVFEGEVMVGLGGDFDFWGLGGEQGCGEAEEDQAFHAGILALRGNGREAIRKRIIAEGAENSCAEGRGESCAGARRRRWSRADQSTGEGARATQA